MKKTLFSVLSLAIALTVIPACKKKCKKEVKYELVKQEGQIMPRVKRTENFKVSK